MGTVLHRALFLAGGGGAWNPFVDLAGSMILGIHAPYEGGNEPSALAAYAQNGSAAPGDPIQTATDWSGNNNHPTQSTLSQRPTWESGALAGVGGSHYFDFDGSDDRWTVDVTMTECYVFAIVDRGVANPRFLWHYGVANNFNIMYTLAQTSSSGIARMRGSSSNEYGLSGVWATGGGIDRYEANFVPDVTAMLAEIDGVSVVTGSSGTGFEVALASASRTVDIGSRAGGFAWDGAIGTFIIFSAMPTAEELTLLRVWAATEWS